LKSSEAVAIPSGNKNHLFSGCRFG
jgi:hypothetical protein